MQKCHGETFGDLCADFRPVTVEGMVGTERGKALCRALVDGGVTDPVTGDTRHVMLIGMPGTGKTTMTRALARALIAKPGKTASGGEGGGGGGHVDLLTSGRCYEVDASTDRGTAFLKGLSASGLFSWPMPMGVAACPLEEATATVPPVLRCNRKSVVIVDEVDGMTVDAQRMLTTIIDSRGREFVLIMAANQRSKVSDDLVSRCHCVPFPRPTAEELKECAMRALEAACRLAGAGKSSGGEAGGGAPSAAIVASVAGKLGDALSKSCSEFRSVVKRVGVFHSLVTDSGADPEHALHVVAGGDFEHITWARRMATNLVQQRRKLEDLKAKQCAAANAVRKCKEETVRRAGAASAVSPGDMERALQEDGDVAKARRAEAIALRRASDRRADPLWSLVKEMESLGLNLGSVSVILETFCKGMDPANPPRGWTPSDVHALTRVTARIQHVAKSMPGNRGLLQVTAAFMHAANDFSNIPE